MQRRLQPAACVPFFVTRAQAGAYGKSGFRLDEERRKLDDEQRAFHDYLRRLSEARDKEEFDRFMAERNAPKPASE